MDLRVMIRRTIVALFVAATCFVFNPALASADPVDLTVNPATGVTTFHATINATVTVNDAGGAPNNYMRFYIAPNVSDYSSLMSSPDRVEVWQQIGGTTPPGVSAEANVVSSLKKSTTYGYAIVSESNLGTFHSDVQTFTTADDPITLSNVTQTHSTGYSGTLHYYVEDPPWASSSFVAVKRGSAPTSCTDFSYYPDSWGSHSGVPTFDSDDPMLSGFAWNNTTGNKTVDWNIYLASIHGPVYAWVVHGAYSGYPIEIINNGLVYGCTDPLLIEIPPLSPTAKTVPTEATTGRQMLGYILCYGNSDVEAHFEWGTTTSYGHTTEATNYGDDFCWGGNAVWSGTDYGLTFNPNTTYHYRLVACSASQGSCGYGNDATFTTPPPPPGITVDNPSNVSSTQGTVNATLDTKNANTMWIVLWSTQPNVMSNFIGMSGFFTEPASSNPSSISYTLTGLEDGTTYYYLFYAGHPDYVNGGTTFSDERSFVAQDAALPTEPPAVQTLPASSVTAGSARLNATVNPNGDNTTYYFEWGPDESYGNLTPATAVGSGTANVNALFDLTALQGNREFHYRVVAENSLGTSYGDDASFLTDRGSQSSGQGGLMLCPF